MKRDTHPANDGAHRSPLASASAPQLPGWLDDAPVEDPPVVDRAELTGYLWLRYDGYKDIDREPGKPASRLHTFTHWTGNGPKFCVWGTADLNQRLRRVTARGVCVLHYAGTLPSQRVNAEPGETTHSWLVKVVPPGVTVEQIRDAAGAYSADHERLSDAIDRAIVAQRERRAARSGGQGGEQPPPHTDDDRRF